jgi:hypothetical protein
VLSPALEVIAPGVRDFRDQQQPATALHIDRHRTHDRGDRAVVGHVDTEAAAERPHFERERAALVLAVGNGVADRF